MKYYGFSEYALNKKSEGIVYLFADSIVVVTLVDFLAENPGKTESDFLVLKQISDGIYLKQERDGKAQTKKNSALDWTDEASICFGPVPSPEEMLVDALESEAAATRYREQLESVNQALKKLTETQLRRYLLYHVKGRTMRQIADAEGVGHTKIQKSLQAADKKIKEALSGM